jgi:hypothetical protein
LDIVKQVKEPLYIKIYLQGDLPAEFIRLQQETQLLEEFQAYNQNIVFEFINPLENEDTSMDNIKVVPKRINPVNITVDDKETISGHGLSMGYSSISEQRSQYSTIEKKNGATTEMVIGSVQHLEYSISDALNKVTTVKQKTVAVIKGNGELQDVLMAKFLANKRKLPHRTFYVRFSQRSYR